MTVLVTGAAGFIGYHVAVALLDRGETVLGLDSFNDYYDPALKEARGARLVAAGGDRFRMLRCDFADDAALAEALAPYAFDRIVHLGAQPGVRHSIERPMAYVAANLVGHVAMLEVARARGVAHMVYASSSSVYGGNVERPFSESHRADHPVSLYAATKKADELMSETYAHLYRLPLTGLRFFTVYGPWGRPDMAPWIFTANILAGKPIRVFNDGRMRRDFTYVDDVVHGVLACLDRPPADDGATKPGGGVAPHAIYNIGNHRAEELMDFIRTVEAACGRPARLDFQPLQDGDVLETHADIDAVRRDVGYEPTTSIAQGVPRFVEWFKRYHGIAGQAGWPLPPVEPKICPVE